MFGHLAQIRWFGVLLGSLGFFLLGGVWFMGLFGKHYAAALGRTDLQGQKPAPMFIIGPFACGVVITTCNAVLISALGITSLGDALQLGALVGVGYLLPMTVNIAINPNFPRPLYYSAINAPYFLLANLLDCVILSAMS